MTKDAGWIERTRLNNASFTNHFTIMNDVNNVKIKIHMNS